MRRINTSRILPVVLVVIIAVIAVAAIISLARLIFSGSSTTPPAAVDTSRESLLNTSIGHGVSLSVRGPIVADESFRSYVIDISSSERTLKTYQGYRDTIIDNKTVANTVQAYDEFVHALDRAGLASGKPFEGDREDTRGICATGKLYEYSILENGNVVKRLWTTTCRNAVGSLRANNSSLVLLFKNQVPDATKLISKVRL